MEERILGCVVEAIGEIQWPEPRVERNEPQPCARVLDDEGHRYIATSGQCFRNGTVINERMVGRRGTIGLYRCSLVWLNCPTLFDREIQSKGEPEPGP